MIYQLGEKKPRIHPTAYIAPSADVIGDVKIGKYSSLWFHTLARGDVHFIRIGNYTNIQDGTMIHVTQKTAPAILGNYITVGHSAVIHGCTIHDYCLIGMGAIILDGAEIGPYTLVAAGSLVPPGFKTEGGVVIMGHPAKIKGPIGEKEKKMIQVGWQHYKENTLFFSQNLSPLSFEEATSQNKDL
ncbi:MAG: gamma carbonic anhydrase family protein [Planctomycetota bacterium]|nr:MAG: gamma carbonic anhydrase family protein [Planctomycetota bacterium]